VETDYISQERWERIKTSENQDVVFLLGMIRSLATEADWLDKKIERLHNEINVLKDRIAAETGNHQDEYTPEVTRKRHPREWYCNTCKHWIVGIHACPGPRPRPGIIGPGRRR
jgi:hypothetical protein